MRTKRGVKENQKGLRGSVIVQSQDESRRSRRGVGSSHRRVGRNQRRREVSEGVWRTQRDLGKGESGEVIWSQQKSEGSWDELESAEVKGSQ